MPPPEKRYKPREMTVVRSIILSSHMRRVKETDGGFTNEVRREDICYDFSDCPHTQGTFIEVDNDHGVWGVVICNNCGQLQSGPECPHVESTWNEEGTLLTCDNCGIDGT